MSEGMLTASQIGDLFDNAPKCEARISEIHGYGLFAKQPIKKGETVLDFSDITLYHEVAAQDLEEWRLCGGKFTALDTERCLVSDRFTKYSVLNHCSEPNGA